MAPMLTTGAGNFPAIGVSAFTFDPANKESNLVLSNSNRQADDPGNVGGSWKSVRTVTGASSGKRYLEIKLLSTPTANPNNMVGVCDSSFPVSTNGNYLGSQANSGGHSLANADFSNGMTVANAPLGTTWASNDIIMLAHDLGAGKVWFGKNGTWSSGDPATGASPWLTYTPAGTWYFAGSFYEGGVTSGGLTLLSTISFSVPSGYTQVNS